MKKLLIVCLLALGSITAGAQTVGIKTNLLYLGTATPNLGIEFGMGKRFTLSLAGGYNPVKLKATETSTPSIEHWLGDAEVRFWTCKRFDGLFIGLQGLYGDYIIEDMPLIELPEKYRYDGTAYGGGIVFGNHWALGRRWGVELSAGVGVLFLEYNKIFNNGGADQGQFKQTYFGPTKLNLSFMYFFK